MGSNFKASPHMRQRCQQRGYRHDDIRLILEIGEDIRDGVWLSRKHAAHAIQQRKNEIQQLERHAGILMMLAPIGGEDGQ